MDPRKMAKSEGVRVVAVKNVQVNVFLDGWRAAYMMVCECEALMTFVCS